jgi:uncharacterized protein
MSTENLMRQFGLRESIIEEINGVFAQYPEIEQAILCGSRAKGNYRNGSDIDLTLVGDLTYNQLLRIENAIDDLLLVYTIDLSLYRQIDNPELLAHIQRVGQVFYMRSSETVACFPQHPTLNP